MTTSENTSDGDAARPEVRTSSPAKLIAGLLGAGVALVLVIWFTGNRIPRLTPEIFAAAQTRWQEKAPSDYNITIEVFGRQPALYRVQVRNGSPIAAFRNDRPLTQQRTWRTWSVPGMFGTIKVDVRNVQLVKEGRAEPTTPRLSLRAQFNQEYGYPEKYYRIESKARGMSPEVRWEVREFTVLNSP